MSELLIKGEFPEEKIQWRKVFVKEKDMDGIVPVYNQWTIQYAVFYGTREFKDFFIHLCDCPKEFIFDYHLDGKRKYTLCEKICTLCVKYITKDAKDFLKTAMNFMSL